MKHNRKHNRDIPKPVMMWAITRKHGGWAGILKNTVRPTRVEAIEAFARHHHGSNLSLAYLDILKGKPPVKVIRVKVGVWK